MKVALHWKRQEADDTPSKTITHADYANDKALLANFPAEAEPLLHSLEQTAGDIGPPVNADKKEYICLNQRENISTLNSGSPKLVDKFIYPGSSVSSMENNINTWLVKVWTAMDAFFSKQ